MTKCDYISPDEKYCSAVCKKNFLFVHQNASVLSKSIINLVRKKEKKKKKKKKKKYLYAQNLVLGSYSKRIHAHTCAQ